MDPVIPGPKSIPPVRKRPNVLIVEDDERTADALVRSLRESYDVTVEAAAADACHRLAIGERYSAVLIDILMPGMNGMELFEWMTGACPGQADRVLFITGASFSGPQGRFLERQRPRVLQKPFEPAGLAQRVQAIVLGI